MSDFLQSTSILGKPPALEAPVKPEPKLRDVGDHLALRSAIFDKSLDAVKNWKPIDYAGMRLEVVDPHYDGKDDYSIRDQKQAILERRSLGRRLRGTWRLTDLSSGRIVDEKKTTLATIPFLTQRGTFIDNGNEYAHINQSRLRPGIYSRIKENGELETFVSIKPGQGVSHRYFLDPEKGVFFANIGAAKIPLVPLLHAMGVSDRDMKGAWGPDIAARNLASDQPHLIRKYHERFLSAVHQNLSEPEKTKELLKKINGMELDPEVTSHTMPRPYASLNKDAILDITRRLLAMSRGEAEADNRDDLAYQLIVGPEDNISERLEKDYGGYRKKLLWRAARDKNLRAAFPGYLNQQVRSALLTSGLGQHLEETNLSELLDKQFRITRMGEGGLSGDNVPGSARAVQNSYLGFIDPLKTPEALSAGVDLYLSRGVKKGDDGKLYAPFLDVRTGETVNKSPQDVAKLTVAFPKQLEGDSKRVWAIRSGKLASVPKGEVDLVLPYFENSFTPLSNLIPMKSAIKGQRASMTSRFLTQALPLVGAESPLVQSGLPGGQRSFEQEYGEKLGAIFAKEPAKVMSVKHDEIRLRHGDGREETINLHKAFPMNRRSYIEQTFVGSHEDNDGPASTYLEQTPAVKVGDMLQPGQLLAYSNYTDKQGKAALGVNARVAYLADSFNHEDAISISESFAKRLSSDHMFPFRFDPSDNHKMGRGTYVSLFPQKFNRKQLDTIDKNGLVKPGTTVNYGDPLVLAVSERTSGGGRVHRKGGSSFSDSAITWEKHSPGTVTDSVQTPNGMTVLVRSVLPTQTADKLSNRYAAKGVVSVIKPDDEMPQDSEGRPFEVLLNPAGLPSRCYDSKTEFLTENGWVGGESLQISDRLVCYHPWSERLFIMEQLDEPYKAQYKGEMLQYKNKLVDFCVTPNHRMWARTCSPGSRWQEVTAERIFGLEWNIPVAGLPIGGEDSDFELPMTELSPNASQKLRNKILLNAGDWAEFLGWYIAEGNTDQKVHIAQSFEANPEKCQRISELLNRLPFKWHYSKKNKQFHIASIHLCQYLKQFGLCHEKFLPEWLFKQSFSTRARFLDSYWLGDGNHQIDGRPGFDHKSASSRSIKLINDLQRLLVYQGISSNTYPMPWEKNRACRWKLRDGYRVAWHFKRHRCLKGCGWSRINYDGMIYCPTVPTGYVVTRRNGRILIAGNTNPAAMIETALGKIAAKTGKPFIIPDFDNIDDLTGYAQDQLRQHGLSDLEDVIDPKTGKKIPNILTGTQFIMKLHHLSAEKQHGRGIGSYTSMGSPSKGEGKCFAPNQKIVTCDGIKKISEICEKRLGINVRTYDRITGEWCYRPVVDWFTRRARVDELLTIYTEGGPCFPSNQDTVAEQNSSVLMITKNHSVYMFDGTQRLAGEVRPGDTLATWGAVPLYVKKISPYKHDEPGVDEINVYDFTVQDTHCYVAGNALVSNSKRLSNQESGALLASGAYNTLRDASQIRGQRNEDFWLNFMQGYAPPEPDIPLVYKKFVADLQASGINVVSEGTQTHIMALTDRDVHRLAGNREVKSGELVDPSRGMKPLSGGLFDAQIFGQDGHRWGFIRAAEPVINPVMEDPVRHLLGMTKKQLEDSILGKEDVHGFGTGPIAIKKALQNINVPMEIARARQDISRKRGAGRDVAVRKLGYLIGVQEQGLKPSDWMLTQIPVLPPVFRQVGMMQDTNIPIIPDANLLYRELIDANDNLKQMSGQVSDVGPERLAVYKALKAVVGLGDPLSKKLQEKKVGGILSKLVGSSPKMSTIQRRLLSQTVDLVGRATLIPNPDLDMDSVAIPEEKAWDVYRNFIVRRLKRKGMPVSEAMRQVEEHTPLAKQEMLSEMGDRPVLVSRAPVLHRYGIQAFWPKLTKNTAIELCPMVFAGFGADADGDALNWHVPVDDSAVQEAKERLLPSRSLVSPADFKSPVHNLTQEYLGALHYMTTQKRETRKPRVFATKKDAVSAWRRGEISGDDQVTVIKSA